MLYISPMLMLSKIQYEDFKKEHHKELMLCHVPELFARYKFFKNEYIEQVEQAANVNGVDSLVVLRYMNEMYERYCSIPEPVSF